VGDEVEAGTLAKAEGCIFDGLEENFGGGGNELVAKGFVDGVLQLEVVELLFVETG
jgi:hypothetical protein